MNGLLVQPLTDESFRPFGRLIRAGRLADLPAWADDLLDRAPTLLGGLIEVSRRKLVAGELVFSEIEIHPASPQLTLCLDAPWLIAIARAGADPHRLAPGAVFAFEVPPGVAVVLDPGLWHCSVLSTDDTRVIAAFRQGTIEGGTQKVTLATTLRIERTS